MAEDRWDLLEALFEQAATLSPHARAAYLDAACQDDAALRAEVESLLAAHDAAPAFFDRLEGKVEAVVPEQVDAVAHPERIGPYRLLQSIGHGGMGTVYLAARDDNQFQQQVAVKLLRGGVATADTVRRFLSERQILALLNHPNIARLLDGGVTLAGQPYFVMEYVEGRPVHTYCDTEKLSIEDRLRLFCTIGEAVHYAHRNLVVHRDLKPGNILVTQDGQPKLLDFGIAKLLDTDAALHTVPMTRMGMRLMTPEYASPEQVQGAPVTTASDVYQLGLLLYELLTGHRPFQHTGRSMQEIERAITREKPAKPSQAVTQVVEVENGPDTDTRSPEAVGAARRMPIERLQKRLRGDLDTIVLKALRKEPERRYASAEALVADIQRHLDGLPVLARKDTLRYRTRKFVQRQRYGVVTALAFVLVLIGYAATVTVQARRVTAERDRAEVEARKAEQVSQFLMDLFLIADPGQTGGEELTAQQLLARGAARVEDELAEQPEVEAQMLTVIGHVYWQLGQTQEALGLHEKALALRQALASPVPADIAESLNYLALAHHDQRDFAQAESLHRVALGLRQTAFGSDHLRTAESYNNLALALHYQGHFAQAAPLYAEALRIKRQHLEETDPSMAVSMTSLAMLYMHNMQDYERAEALLQEIRTMQARTLTPPHPDMARTLNNLASVYHTQADFATAEPLYREAIAIYRAVYEDTHPTVTRTLLNLAVLLHAAGKHTEAEATYREVIPLLKKQYGVEHRRVAGALRGLANLLTQKEGYPEAEVLYREALAIYEAIEVPPGSNVAGLYHHLAVWAQRTGAYQQGTIWAEKALQLRENLVPPDSIGLAETRSVLQHLQAAQ